MTICRRRTAFSAFLGALAVLAAGCSGGADAGAGGPAAPVVERSVAADGVELVRNVSGSVWGRPARLEETLSIGVGEGDPAYMFGRVDDLVVGTEAVFVLDTQLPGVRVYDHEGLHLRDVGQAGEGPGEFTTPGVLDLLADGTLVVADMGTRRVELFDPAGDHLRSWSMGTRFIRSLRALDDGSLRVGYFLPQDRSGDAQAPREAHAELTSTGELVDEREVPSLGHVARPIIVQAGGTSMTFAGFLQLQPGHFSALRPDGALVVGVAETYAFDIHHVDGRRTRVERYWDPVPIDPDERVHAVRRFEAFVRQRGPADYTYDGDPVMDSWPAYRNLYTDRNSRTWVVRALPSERLEGCVENPLQDPDGARERPCWRSRSALDLFAADGGYVGELHRPEGVSFRSVYSAGDDYWAAVEDADGVVRVKRYRIVIEEND